MAVKAIANSSFEDVSLLWAAESQAATVAFASEFMSARRVAKRG